MEKSLESTLLRKGKRKIQNELNIDKILRSISDMKTALKSRILSTEMASKI